MAWSYNVGQISTSALFQVRRLIGDVLAADQQLQDEEINWTLGRFSSIYGAAAECCRDIAAQFARKVDTVQGELRTSSNAARNAPCSSAPERIHSTAQDRCADAQGPVRRSRCPR